MRRIQYNSETKSFSNVTFSTNDDVAQVQRILPKLKGAPNLVKDAALLLADYFRPLPPQGFKYGSGINPKGDYPFIALTDNGSFVDFRAFMPESMRKKIGASSFGRGNYIANDTNVVSSFDESDFLVSYNWLTKSDDNLDIASKEILKFISDNPRYSEFATKKYLLRFELSDINKTLDAYEKALLKEAGVTRWRDLSAQDRINLERKYDSYAESLENNYPSDPEQVIKLSLIRLMKFCKLWVDKYRGFTDIDLRTKIS